MEKTASKYTTFLYGQWKGHDDDITALSFHPQNHTLVSSSLDTELALWKLNDLSYKRFEAHTSPILDVCYSPDGNSIAIASTDKSIRIWNFEDHLNFTEYRGHRSFVRSVQFSPKGDKFVSGSFDKNVLLWETYRENYFKVFSGHTHWVTCAKFSPDGKLLLSCSNDKTIKIWDISSGQCVTTFNMKVSARYVEFHPTDTIIGSANVDGGIKLFDLRTNSSYQRCIHDGRVNMIRFHPNEKFILTASDDYSVKVLLIETLISYNILNGRLINSLKEHKDKVTCIAFSNNGELFASGSTDRQILVWKCDDDLYMDGQSRKSSTLQSVPSATANRNLKPSFVKQKFDDGNERPNSDEYMHEQFDYANEKSKRDEEENKENEDKYIRRYLSSTLKKSHPKSDDSAGSSVKIVEPEKMSIMNVESPQEDYANYVPMLPKQPHNSKQSQTISKDQTSFNTLSNQSIKPLKSLEECSVLKQIQSLRQDYNVLEQRLTILEKSYFKNCM
ncbi:POC1 centriolar protein like protein B [Trachymyrmex cornetzi]|uniref:POC1 centriolar protein like protein B n=1 Tax=Trachymyrmex cornetzi TaxID=471704 RepID=A0A151IUM4_9HYME|nr:POC1 centriolar protein like protein B [Trachymyrmex cornetzi]